MNKWKEINKPWREHELRSGTIVKVQDSPETLVVELLVGEINEMGGTCDDCRWFGHDAVILAELDISDAIETAKKAADQ